MHLSANDRYRIILLSVLLVATMCIHAFAGAGDDGGSIASSINHEYYDIRLDIDSATGPFRFTVPYGEDTVAVPVKMYATDTRTTSGLSIYEFYNVIYYDTTELSFIDIQGIDWYTDSVEIDIEAFSGDTARIEIQGYGDLVGFDPESWVDIYQLRFFIKCGGEDEVPLGLASNEIFSENWVKVTGSSSLEEYDSFDPGYLKIMAYWAYGSIGSVETLLGDDTVRVPIYLDSNNYMFWVFDNFLRYDTANYTFVGAIRSDYTSEWSHLIWRTAEDTIAILGASIMADMPPVTTPVELCTMVFINNAASDNLISPITYIEDSDSNFILPTNACKSFKETIDYFTTDGQIVVPEYEMYAQLNFPEGAQPGDTATMEINVRQNFPAGKYDIGDIQFLFKHDNRFDYYNYGNVHDSVYISVTEINDSLVGINLNLPNGRPGYLPPSEEFVKYCDIYLIVADTCDYSCPDVMTAQFMSSYGPHHATRAVDTTGNVECTSANGKLHLTNDTLDIMCARYHSNSVSGTDHAIQHFYVDHNFVLDSFTMKIAYSSTNFCILSSSVESGVTIDEDYDDDTIMLVGSGLDWGAEDNDHICWINWGARRSGYKTMTPGMRNILTYTPSGISVNSQNTDGSISTNMGMQVPPCRLEPIRWDQKNIPEQFSLRQNSPNPFNPITVISFDLPQSCEVSLEIYNILGQRVTSLVNDHMEAGTYNIPWNSSNSSVSSGVYLYILRAGSFTDSKKMLLVK